MRVNVMVRAHDVPPHKRAPTTAKYQRFAGPLESFTAHPSIHECARLFHAGRFSAEPSIGCIQWG